MTDFDTLSPDDHRREASRLRGIASSHHSWRTSADVQPLLQAAAHLIAAGDIDAAFTLLQPKVYIPTAPDSLINRLCWWGVVGGDGDGN